MRKEYDFSKGERGRLPIYLEHETFLFIEKIAKKQQADLSTVVNKLIETDIKLAKILNI